MKRAPIWMVLSLVLVGCVTAQTPPLPGRALAEEAARSDIGSARDIYDGSLFPDKAVRTYSNTERIFPTRAILAGGKPRTLPASEHPIKALSFSSGGKTYDLPDYVALNRMVGLLILKDGRVVFESYEFGLTPKTRWMSMSLAKSLVSTLVGAAVLDGFISSIHDPVTKYLPQLAGSSYENVTVRDVLMMASGVKWDETYVNPASDRRRLLELQVASSNPGAIFDLMRTLPRATEPGKTFKYNTGETVLVGEIVRSATGLPLAEYASRKIWIPVGMESDAYWWLDSPDGHEVGGSGVLATLRDFGRLGQFILDGAQIDGKRIVPDWWLAEATSAKPLAGVPSPNGYGYQWWTILPQPGSVHEGAFMGRGIHGQYLYVHPRSKVVAVGLGARPKPTGKNAIDDLDFLAAVVGSLAAQH